MHKKSYFRFNRKRQQQAKHENNNNLKEFASILNGMFTICSLLCNACIHTIRKIHIIQYVIITSTVLVVDVELCECLFLIISWICGLFAQTTVISLMAKMHVTYLERKNVKKTQLDMI